MKLRLEEEYELVVVSIEYMIEANVATADTSRVYVAPEIALHLKVKPSSTVAPPIGLVNVTDARASCAVLNEETLETDERYPLFSAFTRQ